MPAKSLSKGLRIELFHNFVTRICLWRDTTTMILWKKNRKRSSNWVTGPAYDRRYFRAMVMVDLNFWSVCGRLTESDDERTTDDESLHAIFYAVKSFLVTAREAQCYFSSDVLISSIRLAILQLEPMSKSRNQNSLSVQWHRSGRVAQTKSKLIAALHTKHIKAYCKEYFKKRSKSRI